MQKQKEKEETAHIQTKPALTPFSLRQMTTMPMYVERFYFKCACETCTTCMTG